MNNEPTLTADLNLSDADDRAILRQRVSHLYRNAKLSAIYTTITELGGDEYPRERQAATRLLSNLYIDAV